MFSQNHQNTIKIAALSTLTVIFTSCNQPRPTVYEIPKEDRTVKITANDEKAASSTAGSSDMQILPGMQEAAATAPEILYQVPKGWEELVPSGIRKGTFKVRSERGSAEVTILTFPGDVGGTLANINRWREQIGLAPATSENSRELSEPYKIANHEGLYVRLQGEQQSILGAILPFHGNTWFFKMMGDTPAVIADEANMKQFLDSIHFKAHMH